MDKGAVAMIGRCFGHTPKVGRPVLVVGALLLASALGGFGPAMPSRAAADSQTLFVANNYQPTSFDPGIAYDQVGPAVFRNVYEPLVRLKGSSSSQYEGVLATHWTASADKKTWTFSIRKRV